MNKFILKSLINSVMENLPKMLDFLNNILKDETKKYKNDFVFVLTSVNDEIFIVPGVINNENIFEQKEFELNGSKYKSVKLKNFITDIINEKLK